MSSKSSKNKVLVICNGYEMRKGRATKTIQVWRCLKKTCNGSAISSLQTTTDLEPKNELLYAAYRTAIFTCLSRFLDTLGIERTEGYAKLDYECGYGRFGKASYSTLTYSIVMPLSIELTQQNLRKKEDTQPLIRLIGIVSARKYQVNGSQVLNFLCQLGFVSEAIIQKLANDLLSALEHLHGKGYAHLGIKPEDLLVECHNKVPRLVLIDMGSCQSRKAMSKLSIWQGGPLEFTAPEQLGHKPCFKSDIWSFGVLLFVVSIGLSPFEDENEEVVRLNILNARFTSTQSNQQENVAINHFSAALLQFLDRIFMTEVSERPSAKECLADGWMLQIASEELVMVDYIQDYVDRRRNRMRSSFLLHEL
uniref:Protein kinase domain-containing protein n=1 Tax=Ditylenchus dipsaci TaxID=166011 RepID=A0A915E9V6_9BILA